MITYKPKPPTEKPLVISLPTLQSEAVAVPVAPVVSYTAPVYSGTTDCGSDPYMAQIYFHESGCRTNAWGPMTSLGQAYGLCQSLPASKMASAGADWATSWATQNAWCINYAYANYGSPALAWAHWQVYRNW